MDLRTLGALASACLCLGAADAAAAQSLPAPQAGRPLLLDLRNIAAAPAQQEFRLQSAGRTAARRTGMVRSWEMDRNADFGLGRFTVPNNARPRTHTERMRSGMDNETRGIAGAGMHVRF